MPRLRLLPPATSVMNQKDATRLLERLMRRGGKIAIDTETTGLNRMKDRVLYWSMATDTDRYFLPAELLGVFDPLFRRPDIRWRLANAKYDMHMLKNAGYELRGETWDIIDMDAMIDDTRPHGLKDQAWQAYEARWGDFKELFLDPVRVAETLGIDHKALTKFRKEIKDQGRSLVGEMLELAYTENPGLVVQYATCDAYFTYFRADDLEMELAGTETPTDVVPQISNLLDYYKLIELPLTKALFGMEREGWRIDMDHMRSIEGPIRDGLAALEYEAQALVQDLGWAKLKINSSDHLREILYGKDYFNLKAPKYNTGAKTGRVTKSTDEKTLSILLERLDPQSRESKFIQIKLEHAALNKALGTYVVGAKKHVHTDGKIHSKINQSGARTSRFSCVAEWTGIRTPRGTLPISTLRPGDQVWTHRGRWRRVQRVFTKGVDHMFDIHLSNGETLTCTGEHRLLSADGAWFPVKDLLCELLETVGTGPTQPEGSSGSLPLPFRADPTAGSGNARHALLERVPRGEAVPPARGEESTGAREVLGLQDGQQEPDAGEIRISAPPLEGGLRGRKRVPDADPKREAQVRASGSRGGDARAPGDPEAPGGAPHRQQPEEQLAGQSGDRHQGGAPGRALFAGRGLPPVAIAKVVYRGRLEVHDLTVEEDASYEACGVLSHNSSDPNLQNIPVHNDKYNLRGGFIADPGYTLIDLDYPQIEFRVAAALAGAKGMIEDIARGWDIHCANGARMYSKDVRVSYEKLMEAKERKDTKAKLLQDDKFLLEIRQAAKTVGLAVMYGEGVTKMAIQLACSKEQAQIYQNNFFNAAPEIAGMIQAMHRYGHETETSYTLLGRTRQLYGINSWKMSMVKQDERRALNNLVQGSSAEIMKLAILRVWYDKEFRSLGGKLIMTVHDELIGQAPHGVAKEVAEVMKDRMGNPFQWAGLNYDLGVPITPDYGLGPSWDKAK
jgi:DNA polymerase I-like protein with 3'-5' exonuclease and polymerase domains